MKKYDFDWDKIKEYLDLGIPEDSTFIEPFKEIRRIEGVLLSEQNEDLSAWETSMTDPQAHGQTFRYLVHAVHDDYGIARLLQKAELCKLAIHDRKIKFQNINLLQNPEKIAQKPLVSASLIDETHRSTWAPGGYILQVPLDNILQTACQDIGTPFWDGQDAVRELYAKRDFCGGIADPDRVLRRTPGIGAFGYNEIVFTGTGRTGKEVQIQGVFVKVLPNGEYVNDDLASTLSRIAYSRDLPFVRILESFYPYQDTSPDVGEDFFGVTIQGVRYLFIPAQQKFQVLEYGGLKSQVMTPEQRKYALDKAKQFLQSSPNQKLEKMIAAAEAVPDEVLEEKVHQEKFIKIY